MPLMEGVGTTPQSSSGDGEAEVFGCIREVVDDVLWDFLCVGEKGAVISKQQLSDEFLDVHPCLTLLEMAKLPDRDPLCFT